MVFCTNCGKGNQNESKYCYNCGADLTQNNAVENAETPLKENNTMKNVERKTKNPSKYYINYKAIIVGVIAYLFLAHNLNLQYAGSISLFLTSLVVIYMTKDNRKEFLVSWGIFAVIWVILRFYFNL